MPAPKPRSRVRQTARDMVWSLAVVGVFVAFLVAVTYREKPDPVRVVDPAPAVAQARAQAAFVPVVPVGLPAAWRPTSARYERAAVSAVPNAALWHLGYLTPTDAYAAVDQVEGDPTVAVRALVEGARPSGVGTGTFAGWQRWQTADGRRTAYVLPGSASTVVVSGSADDRELATFADALRPPPGG